MLCSGLLAILEAEWLKRPDVSGPGGGEGNPPEGFLVPYIRFPITGDPYFPLSLFAPSFCWNTPFSNFLKND